MIDIRRLRGDPDGVRAALGRRGIDLTEVDEAARLDAELRRLTSGRDDNRARRNALSKEVGQAKRAGDEARAAALTEQSRALDTAWREVEAQASDTEERLRQLLLRIPNLPHPDVPDGAGEADNPVVRVVGFDPDGYGPHQRVPHWEIGAELGILDLERGAKIAGSMFPAFRGRGAQLVRALCQLALDRNADAYEEIRPPTFVRTDTLTATGHLPKFADDAYLMERDDLWAIPTAEVPLTSWFRDEILDEAALPVRLMAATPCWRREAGSAGKDTRGLLRVHEFDKVEILAVATEADAPALLEEILDRACATVAALGLPYRVVEICTGDLGQSHHRSLDVEVYSPGVDRWLEVSSCSWFGDYQARRANIRYRPAEGSGTVIAHTLNGSALAVPRIWAALVETNRQPDGTVSIPPVLRPYLRDATTL